MSDDQVRRHPGPYPGRAAATGYGDLVFTVATARVKSASMAEQTASTLEVLDERLALAGSDKTRILSATVYITDMARKPEMDAAWMAWIDPDNLPQRACVGVTLAGDDLIEITVVAVRSRSGD